MTSRAVPDDDNLHATGDTVAVGHAAGTLDTVASGLVDPGTTGTLDTLVSGPSDPAAVGTLDTRVSGPPPQGGGAVSGQPGGRMGRYVLVAELGRGGMGIVYSAFDPELDRKVALKVLRPDASRDPDAETRLVREGRAIAKLAHPNQARA
jgi:hypothetical protein